METKMCSLTDAACEKNVDCPVTICSTPAEAISLTLQEHKTDATGEKDVDCPITICSTPAEAIALTLQDYAINETANRNILPEAPATNIELVEVADVGEPDFEIESPRETESHRQMERAEAERKYRRRALITIVVLLIIILVLFVVASGTTGISYSILKEDLFAPVVDMLNAVQSRL